MEATVRMDQNVSRGRYLGAVGVKVLWVLWVVWVDDVGVGRETNGPRERRV